MFDVAPRLRVIARTGVGYDAIDVEAATARNRGLHRAGDESGERGRARLRAAAGLTRRIVINDREIAMVGGAASSSRSVGRRSAWWALAGSVAPWRPGRTARDARLAFDPLSDPDFDLRHGIGRLGFEELLAESDVVSLHLPLTKVTHGLFNRDVLARMRPGSYLINTARGGLIVEADLHASLVSGHLAGGGLDVLNSEPPNRATRCCNCPTW